MSSVDSSSRGRSEDAGLEVEVTYTDRLGNQHVVGGNTTDPFVPLSIRSRSRIASWLWRRTNISYDHARALARWLP